MKKIMVIVSLIIALFLLPSVVNANFGMVTPRVWSIQYSFVDTKTGEHPTFPLKVLLFYGKGGVFNFSNPITAINPQFSEGSELVIMVEDDNATELDYWAWFYFVTEIDSSVYAISDANALELFEKQDGFYLYTMNTSYMTKVGKVELDIEKPLPFSVAWRVLNLPIKPIRASANFEMYKIYEINLRPIIYLLLITIFVLFAVIIFLAMPNRRNRR